MRQRILTSMAVVALVSAVIVLLPAVPLAGQAPTTAANAKATAPGKTWTPPRTPGDDPDLQGVYNTATATPLQRPSGLGEKDVYGDEEAEVLQNELRESGNTDGRPPRPEYATGNYNDFW